MPNYINTALSQPFKKQYTYVGENGSMVGNVVGLHQGAVGTYQLSVLDPSHGYADAGSGNIRVTHKPVSGAPISADSYDWDGNDLGLLLRGDAGNAIDPQETLTDFVGGLGGPYGGKQMSQITGTVQTTPDTYMVKLSASGFVVRTILCLTFKSDAGEIGFQGEVDGTGRFSVTIRYEVTA